MSLDTVVDTNVVAALMLPTAANAEVAELLRQDHDWRLPPLWRSEFRLQPVAGHQVLALAIATGCSTYNAEFVVLAHGCLPSASSQRCWCQSRCERRQSGVLGTRWRPGLSRPLRLIANSVERLIASWAQSSSVVSQGFEGDVAAGAAGDGEAGEATQEWRGPIPFQSMEWLGGSNPCR